MVEQRSYSNSEADPPFGSTRQIEKPIRGEVVGELEQPRVNQPVDLFLQLITVLPSVAD
jgi:hypothetical protein